MNYIEMCNTCIHHEYCEAAYSKTCWCGNYKKRRSGKKIEKEIKMGKEFDIWNNIVREVVCVRNDVDFCNKDRYLLEIGKRYHVTDVEVHSWHTDVRLEEFPDCVFNSVCFEEVE